MSHGNRPGPAGQIDIPAIPGADNRWFPNQGQARNAALAAANQLGLGYTLAHDPQPGRGLPHYHIVSPNGQRISGHFFYGRRLPRRVLRGRPSRELEEELSQAELELEIGQSAEFMARRPRTPAEEAARQRGSELVRYWIRMLGKSNRSGTPVRPQAQIQAGNQLIQEANRFPGADPHADAFRRQGNQLLRKGRQGLHKSQRGGRRGMREFEEQLALAPAAYEMELERAANTLQRSLEYSPVSTARPTLRRGSTGEAVRDLQSRLQRAGHNPGPIDGIFGSGTDTAVRSFQASQSLTVDGIVGSQTWGRLLNTTPGVPSTGIPTDGELSGAQWVSRFPTSRSVADLAQPFRGNVERFLAALRSAGATVGISATFRPPNRAYCMHYAWRIAREGLDPAAVPAQAGVNIRWVHTDASGRVNRAASQAAAEAMVQAYGIVFRPALESLHTLRRAIDMSISWSGNLRIINGRQQVVTITSTPRTGAENRDLHAVGATYGVIKLVGDAPHWSDNGK